jgi:uncharacterized membrane protein YuzA (DUF378 family)
MNAWHLVLIGLVLIIIAYLIGSSHENFIYTIIIGAAGVFCLMIAFDRSRILFNRWLNR